MSDLSSRVSLLAEPEEFGLRSVALTELDSFLRWLLFSDGLVTGALQAHTLGEIEVSVEDQDRGPVPAAYAAMLELEPGDEAVRRRVAIGLKRSAGPAVLAQSFILPHRLPAHFLASLAKNPDGIGATLEELQLETRRELLCFGLDTAVASRDRSAGEPVLVRLYRIVAGNRPAILIREAFILERRSGIFRLANT